MKKFLGICLVGWWACSAMGAGAPLILDWGTVDTGSAAQQRQSQAIRTSSRAATVQALSARGTAPWLVQFNDVIREEWKTALEAAGARLLGYMPENAFLIEATPKQIAKIGALPDVAYVGEFLPDYKRAAKVRAKLARVKALAEADAASPYRVLLFSGDDLAAVVQKIEALTGAAVAVAEGDQIRTDLTAAQIEEITGWGEVSWVEPYSRPRLWNDVAVRTNMMNVSNVWTTLGLTGAGQTIAVADTGLDSGNVGTIHPDFSGRVTGYGWSNGAYSASYSWADYDEHGTHVSGSVLGDGTMSTGRYKGVAYEANLVFQGTQEDLSGLPTALATLFRQAYTNGARIHSDSWGYDDHGYYNTDSRAVDQYVWSNKNFLILVAAGNSGTDSNTVDGVIDPMSVASPATAKNCLTVGASENYRTTGGYSTYTWGAAWPDDYPASPVSADYLSRPMSNNVQGLAAFSARGPCNDGRIKPDVVAPGTDIISTRTRKVAATGWGTVSGNTNYIYMGGTSMATPLTAGAAGLLRQWVTTTGGITNPSAALMKALMLNGARDMTPGQYLSGSKQEIFTRPDKSQGWGHVDLFNTLQPATNQFLDLYDTNSLATGQTNTFTYSVTSATTNKFIATLAYADYWGTVGSGKQLVNDLDLTVIKPGGTTNFANGRTSKDATNNVELVEFTADEAGTYTVIVSARTVPSGSPQAYALVVRGPEADETPAAPTFGANPGPVSTTTGVEVAFAVSASGYPTPVLALQSTTASSGYSFTPATGQLTYTPPAIDGGDTQTFTFTATNTEGAATQTVSVVVYEAPPAAPAAIWASATNATDFMAAWSSVSGATGYRLDVATNSFAGGGSASELFISEYIEADSGNEKYIEIFNGTGSSVNLTNYSLLLFVNGSSSPTTIALTGTVANNDVFVVANSSATNTAVIDLTSGSLTFNGNDAVALSNKTAGGYADVIGQIGYDPGTGWGTDPTTTVNSTLVRKSGISAGDTDGSDAFDPATEWDGYAGINVEDDLGSHTFAGGGGAPVYVPGYSNRTVAGTSQSVTGLTSGATYYFRARAVSGGGTSPNSPTATVTTAVAGTPPTMDAIPAQITYVGGELDYTVTAQEPDLDTVTFACTSAVDVGTWDLDVNTGDFLFMPTTNEMGTNVFSFTATDKDGTSGAELMSVKVYSAVATNEFTQWVEDQQEDPADTNYYESADADGDGATTYEEYLADTDPAASNSVLRMEGLTSDLGQFSFPASPARYYQLEYCTDITNQGSVVVSNLGWGVPGMVVTNVTPSSWFGVIRALLAEP